ncbi:MAG: hypothetical protein KDD62_16340, partial [Bdellovibrionales bacterium]|nr:hypothetical protein [Bdellovibrionales bacterium]
KETEMKWRLVKKLKPPFVRTLYCRSTLRRLQRCNLQNALRYYLPIQIVERIFQQKKAQRSE